MTNQAPNSTTQPPSGEETRSKKRELIIVLLVVLAAIAIFLLFYFRGCGIVGGGHAEPSLRPKYQYSIYGGGDIGPLNNPLDAAVNPDNGLLYVADTGNRRIAVFDLKAKGKPQFEFSRLDGNNKLLAPDYLAISRDGEVYVSDRRLGTIFVFSGRGRFIRKLTPNHDPNFIWSPLGIYIDRTGNLYVTDVNYNRILKLDSYGRVQFSFGKAGAVASVNEGKGKLYFPNDISLDDKNNIYVSDSNNRRVQIFGPKGKPKTVIGVGGLPRGLCVETVSKKTYVYVVDALAHQVNIFDSKGNLEYTFGKQGTANAEFLYPNGLTIGDDGAIYVVDKKNKRIQVWK